MQTVIICVFVLASIIEIAEFLYILSLRNNLRSIAQEFSEKMSTDTNTTVSVSIVDPEIRRLTLMINRELIALRKEQLKLQQGERELKDAVTSTDDDITPTGSLLKRTGNRPGRWLWNAFGAGHRAGNPDVRCGCQADACT